ncbi:hypothetical protein OQA88_10020 [Cercophora sp. LCS_1]
MPEKFRARLLTQDELLEDANTWSDDDDAAIHKFGFQEKAPDYKHGSSATTKSKYSRCCSALLGFVAVLLVSVLALLVYVALALRGPPTDEQCARQLSLWSPALEAVSYVNYDWPNEFDSTSKYRGPPTLELEEIWENLTMKPMVELPPSTLPLLNRSGATNHGYVHAYNDPSRGYIAVIEVFHQLHCLNMLRQYTWWLMGKYSSTDGLELPTSLREGPVGNRMHADHCIETLRLSLFCSADVTPLLIRIDPEATMGDRADFSSHHRCRDFEKIEGWIDGLYK